MRVFPQCAFLFVAVLLVGCGMKSSREDVTHLGSHEVLIKHNSDPTTTSFAAGDYDAFEFTCEEFAVFVRIRDETLTVNKTSYGRLNPGDSVLIDYGKVLVNGTPRDGVPAEGLKPGEGSSDSKPSSGGTS